MTRLVKEAAIVMPSDMGTVSQSRHRVFNTRNYKLGLVCVTCLLVVMFWHFHERGSAPALFEPAVGPIESEPLCPWRQPEEDLQRFLPGSGQLSGGEMQRVAIARALVNQPSLLLADEPTGNLDTKTGESIFSLFHSLTQEGLTIVVVTHNMDLARSAHRRIELADGHADNEHA